MALTLVALALASLGSLDLIAVPEQTPFSSGQESARIFVWMTGHSEKGSLKGMGNQCYLTATSGTENKILGTTFQSPCIPEK